MVTRIRIGMRVKIAQRLFRLFEDQNDSNNRLQRLRGVCGTIHKRTAYGVIVHWDDGSGGCYPSDCVEVV